MSTMLWILLVAYLWLTNGSGRNAFGLYESGNLLRYKRRYDATGTQIQIIK